MSGIINVRREERAWAGDLNHNVTQVSLSVNMLCQFSCRCHKLVEQHWQAGCHPCWLLCNGSFAHVTRPANTEQEQRDVSLPAVSVVSFHVVCSWTFYCCLSLCKWHNQTRADMTHLVWGSVHWHSGAEKVISGTAAVQPAVDTLLYMRGRPVD